VSYYSATLEGNLITGRLKFTGQCLLLNYGTTTNYGTTIAASTPSMTATGAFSVNLTGLQPNTTYHFHPLMPRIMHLLLLTALT